MNVEQELVLQHGTDSYIMITWHVGQACLFSFNLLNLATPLQHMRYTLYYLSSLFYFRRYFVTLMAPSLYLLLDIVYSLISTLLYSHVYKLPVLVGQTLSST